MRSHTLEHRVRYDECDPMGYVHHSVYLQYFEMGRTELLRACGGRYREMEEAGQLVVVIRVDCRYKAPARYDDLIQIRTEVSAISDAKIVHDYTVLREQKVLTTAQVTMAVIDRNGNLQRVPSELIERYER